MRVLQLKRPALSLHVLSVVVLLSAANPVASWDLSTKSKPVDDPTLTPLVTLDDSLSDPSVVSSVAASKTAHRRFIFVGDVHGCARELDALLDQRLGFTADRDTIVFTGDLVAKGPDSQQVVDRARNIGAYCVRGNHDDKVIRWRSWLDRERTSSDAEDQADVSDDDIVGKYPDGAEVEEGLFVGSEHMNLARSLSQEALDYLRSCPLILAIPSLRVYVAHAGLYPGLSLAEQDPRVVMNIRSIRPNGRASRKSSKGRPWAGAWSNFQDRMALPNTDGRDQAQVNDVPDGGISAHRLWTVIYGHDAGSGLRAWRWAVGLDSAAVKGGSLTAYVLPEGIFVSQPAFEAYMADDGW